MGTTHKIRFPFYFANKLPLFILLLTCMAFAPDCPAQNLSVPHKLFTPHDGLASMVNQQLYEDSRGYIWFASNEGIAYFNGYEFKRIEDHPGFSTEFIMFIEEDQDGRLLLLSETHLTIFDGRDFKAIPLPYAIMAGTIGSDEEGHHLFGLQNLDTLKFFKLNDDRLFEQIKTSRKDGNRFELGQDEKILHVGGSNLYSTKGDKLIVRDLDDFTRAVGHQVDTMFFPPLGYSYRRFAQPPKDYYVFSSLTKTLYVFSTFQEFYENFKEDFLFHRNPPGKRGDFIYLPEVKEYFEIEQTTGEFIWRSLQDQSGQLWVSTSGGVYKFFLNGIFQLESEPASTIWGVSEWQGRLLFHSYRNGLIYYKDGQWQNIPINFSNGELFPGKAVSSEDFHFIPSWDGVFTLDKNFQTYYLETERFPEGLYVDTLTNELVAADERNLYFFDLESLSLRETIRLPNEATRVGIFNISELSGDWWLAGPGGVIRYRPDGNLFDTYTFTNGKLPCKSAVNIYIDEWEEIWVTGNCGLMRWNSQNGVFENNKELFNGLALVDMIDLGENHYLISSNTALFVLDIERNTTTGVPKAIKILREFNQHNGFEGIKPYLSGFFRDPSNRIWIPTASGTFMVDTRLLNLDSSPASIKLTSIDGKLIPFTGHTGKSTFELPYGNRTVNIGFDMICFDWPGQTGFQYRLKEKGDWSPPQGDAIVRLIDLDHGFHKVEIRAVFSDRPEEEWPFIRAGIKVKLPFWERSWFPLFAAIMVLILGIAIGGSWLYNRRIRLKQFQMHNQLQLLQIHALESQLNPHFVFNVLTNIQKKVVMDEPEQANEMIVNLGNLMRRYLESIESGINKSSQLHKNSLSSELELIQLYMDFEREKYRGKFSYKIELEDGINPDTTLVFPMLMQPFVENSIKHGFAGLEVEGKINIRIYREGDGLCIEVADNGIGRQASLEKNKDREVAHRSRGNLLVSRRVELLQKLGHKVRLKTIDLEKGTLVGIFTPVFKPGSG